MRPQAPRSPAMGDQPISMLVRQHQSGKDVPVPCRQAVDVLRIETATFQPIVKILFVRIEVGGVGGVDDFNLADRIRHACLLQL